MTSAEALALLKDANARLEAYRAAVEAEAFPSLLAAWEAEPGKLPRGFLGRAFWRVGLVERKYERWPSGAPWTFDMVWLDVLLYRPTADTELFLEDGRLVNGRTFWALTNAPTLPIPAEPLSAEPGPVWFREVGTSCMNGRYLGPWVHCGVNMRERDRADAGLIGTAEPIGEIEAQVYPAWLKANGGPK